MQIEVATKLRLKDNTVIIDVKLLPRGSGNRNAARRLGESFRRNPHLKDHIKKIVIGTSRVTIHLISSVKLLAEIQRMIADNVAQRDDPGQLPLFESLKPT